MKLQKRESTSPFKPGDVVRLGGSRSGVEADIIERHPVHSDYWLCAWLDQDTTELEECYYHIRDLTLISSNHDTKDSKNQNDGCSQL